MAVIEAATVRGRKVRRVFLDGRDVTNECFAFDADGGWADCWQKDAAGQYVRDPDDPLRRVPVRLTGKVRVEWLL